LLVRTWKLHQRPLFVDEAESVFNALSILQTGVPTNQYLGLPMYENTLVRPWPESTEYEFADSSYSRKGVATYHGWLPLYATAASLKLFGIDTLDRTARPLEAVVNRINIAARLPAVLWGM